MARPARTQPQKRHARVLSTRRDASRDPFAVCTQTVCARNMRHLKTLGRATNLSSSKLHHIERQTGREWRIHPHMHRNTPHADFGPAQTPPWTPLRTQNVLTTYGTSESARISCPSKCSISSAAPVLSGVLMHTPVGTLRTHALAMPEACREPFAVIWSSQWHLS